MSDEKEFPSGMNAKKPHDNAPQFVVCGIGVKRLEFINWLMQKTDDWVDFQVKISKAGKYYVEVDNWKPSNSQVNELKQAAQGTAENTQPDFNDSDIPF